VTSSGSSAHPGCTVEPAVGRGVVHRPAAGDLDHGLVDARQKLAWLSQSMYSPVNRI